MRVLSILSFLPLEGQDEIQNDVVLKIQKEIHKERSDIEFDTVYPSRMAPPLLAGATSPEKRRVYRRISAQKEITVAGERIQVLPYFSKVSLDWLHAFLSLTLVVFNRKRCREIISKNKYDLIFCHSLFPGGWLASYLSRKYGVPFILSPRRDTILNQRICGYFSRFFLKGSAGRVTPNYLVYKQLNNEGIATQFIPHGLQDVFFNTPKKIKSAGTVSLLTIAKFLPRKKIDACLRVIAVLSKEFDLRYTIIGDGSDESRSYLRGLSVQLGLESIVTFSGHRDHSEIPDIISQHDIFLMPSAGEIFGCVYLEAMAIGLPVIYGKSTGIDGFVPEGEVGFAVDPESDEAILKALRTLISDTNLRESMGKHACLFAQEFSWESVCRRYINLMEESLSLVDRKN